MVRSKVENSTKQSFPFILLLLDLICTHTRGPTCGEPCFPGFTTDCVLTSSEGASENFQES